MHLQWTEPAEHDLESIGEFYRNEAGERIAADNVLRIVRAVAALVEMPERSRSGRVPGTRELVVQGLPFIVPYRIRGDEIQVLRVFHTSRNPPASW